MPRKLKPFTTDELNTINKNYTSVQELLASIHSDLQGHVRATEIAKFKRLADKFDGVIGPIIELADTVPAETPAEAVGSDA